MQENKKKRNEGTERRKGVAMDKKQANIVPEMSRSGPSAEDPEETVRFIEEDNVMDMGVSAEQEQEFLSQSEQEENSDSEIEEGELISRNNNATGIQVASVTRSPGAATQLDISRALPGSSENCPMGTMKHGDRTSRMWTITITWSKLLHYCKILCSRKE